MSWVDQYDQGPQVDPWIAAYAQMQAQGGGPGPPAPPAPPAPPPVEPGQDIVTNWQPPPPGAPSGPTQGPPLAAFHPEQPPPPIDFYAPTPQEQALNESANLDYLQPIGQAVGPPLQAAANVVAPAAAAGGTSALGATQWLMTPPSESPEVNPMLQANPQQAAALATQRVGETMQAFNEGITGLQAQGRQALQTTSQNLGAPAYPGYDDRYMFPQTAEGLPPLQWDPRQALNLPQFVSHDPTGLAPLAAGALSTTRAVAEQNPGAGLSREPDPRVLLGRIKDLYGQQIAQGNQLAAQQPEAYPWEHSIQNIMAPLAAGPVLGMAGPVGRAAALAVNPFPGGIARAAGAGPQVSAVAAALDRALGGAMLGHVMRQADPLAQPGDAADQWATLGLAAVGAAAPGARYVPGIGKLFEQSAQGRQATQYAQAIDQLRRFGEQVPAEMAPEVSTRLAAIGGLPQQARGTAIQQMLHGLGGRVDQPGMAPPGPGARPNAPPTAPGRPPSPYPQDYSGLFAPGDTANAPRGQALVNAYERNRPQMPAEAPPPQNALAPPTVAQGAPQIAETAPGASAPTSAPPTSPGEAIRQQTLGMLDVPALEMHVQRGFPRQKAAALNLAMGDPNNQALNTLTDQLQQVKRAYRSGALDPQSAQQQWLRLNDELFNRGYELRPQGGANAAATPVQPARAAAVPIPEPPIAAPTEAPAPAAAGPAAGRAQAGPAEPPPVTSSLDYALAPEQLAGKTWYHGTGTPGLTPEGLDPFRGAHEALYGHGVYLTDNPEIAQGYANARGRRTGTPTVYETQVGPVNALDLEAPIQPKVAEAVNRYVPEGYQDEVNAVVRERGQTNGSLIDGLREAITQYSRDEGVSSGEFVETFQNLNNDLRGLGYDALTHVGGKRTGKPPHQVLIMLDPNDTYSQVGRAGQVRRFQVASPPLGEAAGGMGIVSPGFRPAGDNFFSRARQFVSQGFTPARISQDPQLAQIVGQVPPETAEWLSGYTGVLARETEKATEAAANLDAVRAKLGLPQGASAADVERTLQTRGPSFGGTPPGGLGYVVTPQERLQAEQILRQYPTRGGEDLLTGNALLAAAPRAAQQIAPSVAQNRSGVLGAIGMANNVWKNLLLMTGRYHIQNTMEAATRNLAEGYTYGPQDIERGLQRLDMTQLPSDITQGWNPIAEAGVMANVPVLGGATNVSHGAGQALEQMHRAGVWLPMMERQLGAAAPDFMATLSQQPGIDAALVNGRLGLRNGQFGVRYLDQTLQEAGASPTVRRGAVEQWSQTMQQASDAGVAEANRLHFNYADQRNIDQFLNAYMPFHVWATRNLPYSARFLAEHPAYAQALVDLDNKITQQAAGPDTAHPIRPRGFWDKTPIDQGGLAQAVMGRPGILWGDPTVFAPTGLKSMYSEFGSAPESTPEGNVLDMLSRYRMAPNPMLTAIPWLAGAFGPRQPTNILPQTRAIANVTGYDPERLWQGPAQAIMGAATGQQSQAAYQGGGKNVIDILRDPAYWQQGDATLPYQRRQIISEIAASQGINAGQDPNYLRAMNDPSSPIYQQADQLLRRQRAGLGAWQFMVPMPTRLEGQQEENIRQQTAGYRSTTQGSYIEPEAKEAAKEEFPLAYALSPASASKAVADREAQLAEYKQLPAGPVDPKTGVPRLSPEQQAWRNQPEHQWVNEYYAEYGKRKQPGELPPGTPEGLSQEAKDRLRQQPPLSLEEYTREQGQPGTSFEAVKPGWTPPPAPQQDPQMLGGALQQQMSRIDQAAALQPRIDQYAKETKEQVQALRQAQTPQQMAAMLQQPQYNKGAAFLKASLNQEQARGADPETERQVRALRGAQTPQQMAQMLQNPAYAQGAAYLKANPTPPPPLGYAGFARQQFKPEFEGGFVPSDYAHVLADPANRMGQVYTQWARGDRTKTPERFVQAVLADPKLQTQVGIGTALPPKEQDPIYQGQLRQEDVGRITDRIKAGQESVAKYKTPQWMTKALSFPQNQYYAQYQKARLRDPSLSPEDFAGRVLADPALQRAVGYRPLQQPPPAQPQGQGPPQPLPAPRQIVDSEQGQQSPPTPAAEVAPASGPVSAVPAPPPVVGQIVNAARQFEGTKYVLGGTTKNGIDCSALVRNAFKSAGITLTGATWDMVGQTSPVSAGEARAGDLVFFKNTYSPEQLQGITPPNRYTHVGIYLGNGQMINARTGGKGGVQVEPVSNLGQYEPGYFRPKALAV